MTRDEMIETMARTMTYWVVRKGFKPHDLIIYLEIADQTLKALDSAGANIMYTHRDEPGVERSGMSFYGDKD
jgi:hypothetical protein